VVAASLNNTTRGTLQTFMNPAPLTNTLDFNRDGRIDATDQILARMNYGVSLTLFAPSDPSDPTLPASTGAIASPSTSGSSSSPYTISMVDGAQGTNSGTDQKNSKHAKNPRNPHK